MNYAFERAHAPHVDPEWTNAFIVEARLANLNGTTIGDALAEIDAHVVSSGESAKAAFGSTLLRPGAGHQRRRQPHVDGGCRHSSCGTDHRGDPDSDRNHGTAPPPSG